MNEDLVAMGLIAGITALPLAFGTPFPYDDAMVALVIAIGAILITDTGAGSVSVGPANIEVPA